MPSLVGLPYLLSAAADLLEEVSTAAVDHVLGTGEPSGQRDGMDKRM